jgi:hypothetical protein
VFAFLQHPEREWVGDHDQDRIALAIRQQLH